MFKGGFGIEIMQPQPPHHHHDQWGDYSNGLMIPPAGLDHHHHNHNPLPSYSKPMMILENRFINLEMENNDHQLPQWIEHVTKQLIDHQGQQQQQQEPQTTLMFESNNVGNVQTLMGDLLRPRKAPRRNYDDSAGNHHHHQWCSTTTVDNHEGGEEDDNSNNEFSKSSSSLIVAGKGVVPDDQVSLNLITLLMECAVAISVDNIGEAHRMLLELTQMATPYGPSCAERIVAYFSKAMASRVVNSWLGICSPLISHKTLHAAFQVFNNIAPFIKFAHFTSNQSILEAFHRRDRVHIIDLDIMQGLQWPALFHILATRLEGPPQVVRMTGMGTSVEVLMETGKQLSNFAKRLGMSFEFHPIARKFGDVDASMLQIRPGEAVAVHWLQHSMYDATGPDWKTMRLLQEISPRVITLVEQEIAHGGSFLDRFVGSLHYYSTIFDALGAYLKNDDPNRHRVEHDFLYKEINNILAIGGPARSGEDKFKHWRNELLKNGFVQVGMSTSSMAQAQLILNMYPPSHGYSLVQGDGTLRLGWKDTSLYSVSAWTSPNYSR